MTESPKIHKKSINNAISAYLMIFVSLSFLFNKDNVYLNNDFVKSHTKSAFLIHLGFLITYIIFMGFGVGQSISLLGFQLNFLISSMFFLILLMTLIYGIYTCTLSKVFKVSDTFVFAKREKIFDINGDNILDEKDKLTLILTYIPLAGYIIAAKYYINPVIKKISLINLISFIIIVSVYIAGYPSFSLLLSLLYIIFGVFASTLIVVSNSLISINLKHILSPEQLYISLKGLGIYLKNYIHNKTFIPLKSLQSTLVSQLKREESENILLLKNSKKSPLPTSLIYFPILNISCIFFLKTTAKFHIINGLILTLLVLLVFIAGYFSLIPTSLGIFILIPIFFGIGYSKSRPAYKMPFIYAIYEVFISIKNMFIQSKAHIKEREAEEHSETLQVKK